MELTCFIDFLCPWSYQASLWLRQVRQALREQQESCTIRWRFFSLEQQNKPNDAVWQIWQDSVTSPRSKGFLPFLAGACADLQDSSGLDRFYAAAGKLWHELGQPIWQVPTIIRAAQMADLDSTAIEAKLFDKGCATELVRRLQYDHNEARELFNIFGTPTVVFPHGRAAYLAMMPQPSPEQALGAFYALRTIVEECPTIFEVKHPRTAAEESFVQERTAHIRRALFS
jgi:predicted DsbA family dithiol-disulfide isomerase